MDYNAIKEMAKDEGGKVTDYLALAPNNDPFYIGQPSQIAGARWFASLWMRLGFGRGTHLRRIHYVFVSQSPQLLKVNGTPYENTDNDWKYLGCVSKWARYLNLVPADAFIDRRNPDPIIYVSQPDDDDPSFEVSGGEWNEYTFSLPSAPELGRLPEDLPEAPGFVVSGYDGMRQPYLVEVWAEKTTMNDVLEPLCRDYGTNLITGAGELSATAVLDFMKRVRHDGRPGRILYVSDFDPAGIGMPISVARKIEFFQRSRGFANLEIGLMPIVLTSAQIATYRLPRVPVKDSDKRKGHFEAAHGEGQVELDALEALYPGELVKIVKDTILNYYDPTLAERTAQQRSELEGALEQERREILEQQRAEVETLRADYGALVGDFEKTRQRFNEIARQFQPEIEAYRERLEQIKERGRALYGKVYAKMEAASIDIDDYALPDPDLPEEADELLYDSTRDYFEQLEAYSVQRTG